MRNVSWKIEVSKSMEIWNHQYSWTTKYSFDKDGRHVKYTQVFYCAPCHVRLMFRRYTICRYIRNPGDSKLFKNYFVIELSKYFLRLYTTVIPPVMWCLLQTRKGVLKASLWYIAVNLYPWMKRERSIVAHIVLKNIDEVELQKLQVKLELSGLS